MAQQEQFIASLIRNGETDQYAFEVLAATDWEDAEREAHKWAREFHANGGVVFPCSLHLKLGAKGKFLEEWTDC